MDFPKIILAKFSFVSVTFAILKWAWYTPRQFDLNEDSNALPSTKPHIDSQLPHEVHVHQRFRTANWIAWCL